jgi:branched-chain amino acid transport system substrate-binding protein
MPGGKAFKAKFEAKYGPIQVYAPYAYDAVYVLVEAMKRAGSAEPAQVVAALAQTDHQGVTGPLKFDDKGDTVGGAVTMYEVKDGAWSVLETVK